MFELYMRCPATGDPVYAGFSLPTDGDATPNLLMKNSVCPACGDKHEWRGTAVWSVPLNLPSYEAPEASSEAPPVQTPAPEVARPKVVGLAKVA